jgi:hypothetical protein
MISNILAGSFEFSVIAEAGILFTDDEMHRWRTGASSSLEYENARRFVNNLETWTLKSKPVNMYSLV